MKNFGEKGIENPEINPQNAKHADHDLISRKFLISRFATVEKNGSANLYLAAKNLYAALYRQEDIKKLIQKSDKFPDRISTMEAPLSTPPKTIPAEEEFIEVFRKTLTRKIDYGECVSEEARGQLFQAMQLSEQTVIWTDGDNMGIPEQGLPGSKEQFYKIATAQFYNKMRQELARDRNVKRSDVLSVVATEGKMEFIENITKTFLQKQINTVILVEDRLKNIVQATDLIKKHAGEAISVFPVWVRQSEYKDKIEKGKSLEEWVSDFHAINTVGELMDLLKQNNIFVPENKVGSIFDLDGVLSDDKTRKEQQIGALIAAFKEKGWI
jgi:hypothetical protein